MSHVRKRREVRAEVWCGNLRDTDHSEGPGVSRRIILKGILRKPVKMAWTGLIWIMTRTGSGLL